MAIHLLLQIVKIFWDLCQIYPELYPALYPELSESPDVPLKFSWYKNKYFGKSEKISFFIAN
jgi:hypothetical protein